MLDDPAILKAEEVRKRSSPVFWIVGIESDIIMVRGLDCLDGTPLLDLKPDRGLFTPIAPPQPGDFQVGDL